MKSFVFRFLFVIIIVISIIASSTLSTSAESVSGTTEVYPFNVNSIDIALYDSNGNAIDINADVGGSDAYVEEGRVRFRIERADGVSFSASSRYLVDISLSVTDSFYYNPERCIAASYRYSVSSFASIMQYEDINIAYRALNWGEKIVHDGKFTYKAKNVADVYYPYSAIDESFTKYFNRIMVKFDSTSSFLYLNLLKVDFSVLTEAERSALLITENQDKNTDKILNAGSDVAQPDFDTTNGQLDDTTAQLGSIEGEYQIDQEETQTALDKGNAFISGSELQLASVQIKTWIEKFTSDNPIMLGFFLSVMCLGLCLWIIGRKAGGG